MCVIGIDGCRAGWVYIQLDSDVLQQGVINQLSAIEERIITANLSLIDMPFGLKSGGRQPGTAM